MAHIFIYGPPLSGKSTLGKSLANRLQLPFLDLDQMIADGAKRSIPEIFRLEGEPGFREHELDALAEVCSQAPQVIALGGGALLSAAARELVESKGQTICLSAPLKALLLRHPSDGSNERPLLAGDITSRLEKLLAFRKDHYDSFPLQLDTSTGSIDDLTWQAQILLGAFRVSGMGQGYDVRVQPGGLNFVGRTFRERNIKGPLALVSDEHVFALHGETALASLRNAGYRVTPYSIPPGEENKTIHTVLKIWDHFIAADVERSSAVIALGGGVVGDMTGFAAATFLRGVPWINIPTTLLAMVDSSLGGKTGIDLPQAKNLVGAFYPPCFVLADPNLLQTLPDRELRGGMAEVVKHGIIADPELFAMCFDGKEGYAENLDLVVRRGMMVKIRVIEADPFEKGMRQSLNLGHTIGHGVEIASGFRLSHGEAVAIGTAVETRIAEDIGLAEPGLSQKISFILESLGLPVRVPREIDLEKVIHSMQFDKKRAAGQIHFALPVHIGEVITGVVIEDWPQKLKQAVRSVS